MVENNNSRSFVVNLSERAHPYHAENLELWQDCYLAYRGGKEFIYDALERHSLEFEEDFERRRNRAFYFNFVKRIVNAMTDVIYDSMIVRPSPSDYPVIAPFYRRASNFGESYNTFTRRMSKMSSVFGWVVVAVEHYASKPPTLADVEAGKSYPRLSLYTPLEFVDWVKDGDKFSYGLVRRTIYRRADLNDPLSEIIELEEHIVYTDKYIVIVQGDDVVGEYKHSLGRAPLVLVNDSTVDEFGFSEPLIKDVSRIARALVNWLSVIDEVFERQTLSQLVCPDDGSLHEEAQTLVEQHGPEIFTDLSEIEDYTKIVLKRIGTSKIFTYPANAGHPPQYISPPASNIGDAWDIIMQLAATMFFLVGLGGVREDLYTSSSKARQSVLSLMQSYLQDKASNLQTAEEEILSLYFAYMPEQARPSRIEVRYPAEIDVGPYIEFFSTVLEMLKVNLSEEFNKVMAKRLVDKCPYITMEEKDRIKRQIEEKGVQIPIIDSTKR